MKITYIDWNPKPNSLVLVQTAEDIIDEYQAAGYTLTLRQLYYQFVARDVIENTEKSYKNLGSIITKARMAGFISWDAIEDRSREHQSFWYDEDVMNPLLDLPDQIRFDRWARQDYYVEVWVEKEALGNIIERACGPYLVPHLACKGYLSASEAWRAGRRFKKKLDEGKQCVMIHLGDHDPSGIDMTRDNSDRLGLFAEDAYGVDVIRLALNMDQIKEYGPPANPTKVTDSRADKYIQRFGHTSWELDALEPQVLEVIIQREIKKYINIEDWEAVDGLEIEARKALSNVYDMWEEIEPIVSR